MKEARAVEDVDSALRRKPDPLGFVFRDGENPKRIHSVRAGEPGEDSFRVHHRSASFRADPEWTAAIFAQGHDVGCVERGSVAGMESGESHVVEPRQPLPRPNPEVTIMRLDYAADGTLRQAVLDVPLLQNVLSVQRDA